MPDGDYSNVHDLYLSRTYVPGIMEWFLSKQHPIFKDLWWGS